MVNSNFDHWCRKATQSIRFTPDRKKVHNELMAHLEDHRDTLVAQGMDEQTAQQAAMDAMGDCWELSYQLAQVHRPFWAYAQRITRIAAAILCALAFVACIRYGSGIASLLRLHDVVDTTKPPSEIGTWEVVGKFKFDVSDWTDGYYFRIPSAVLWQREDDIRITLHLQTFFLPIQGNTDAAFFFWAMDDQGNHYVSSFEDSDRSLRLSRTGIHAQTQGAQCFTMCISGLPSTEIQWVELHYDRDGRDVVLRIDLTGGDTP